MTLQTDALLHRLGSRQVPKIDGSEGGFIGLVVGLCVIILACCAAVFYLLTYHKPSSQDRDRRRRQHSFHQRQSSTGSMHSFKEKFATLFTFGARSPSRSAGGPPLGLMKRGQGWVQAGSGDEWETDSGDESPHRRSSVPPTRDLNAMERGDTRRNSLPASSTTTNTSRHPPPSSDSTSSIELATPTAVHPAVYTDPFSSRGRSPSPRSTDSFQSSEQSPGSPVRTFEGGTKFKEHL